ncbi:MAG: hypothetical protein JJU28_22845 [Cyclobacteriaceae bacterium]|nr:hypothetical protein [Cyclobacteriaceae bacterium]
MGGTGAGTLPGFGENEIGGIINVDVSSVLNFYELNNITDVLLEEVMHAAIHSMEALAMGGIQNVDIPRGNDEFTAKSIVGQVEKEIGREITQFTPEEIARTFGRSAFERGSTDGYHQKMKEWQNAQTGSYKSAKTNSNIPSLFTKFVQKQTINRKRK